MATNRLKRTCSTTSTSKSSVPSRSGTVRGGATKKGKRNSQKKSGVKGKKMERANVTEESINDIAENVVEATEVIEIGTEVTEDNVEVAEMNIEAVKTVGITENNIEVI